MRIHADLGRQFPLNRRSIVLAVAALASVAGLPMLRSTVAQDQPAEEEAAVVVGEDDAVVSEEATAGAGESWNARQLTMRKIGEKPAFIRHSSEAFDDPDKRLSLELKYYFELPDQLTAGSAPIAQRPLAHGPKDVVRPVLLFAGESSGVGTELNLPVEIDSPEAGPKFDVEWLDSQASKQPKVVAAILPAGQQPTASLVVARAARNDKGLEIEKPTASRQLNASELLEGCVPGGLLDTWDRPQSLGSRSLFFGRVIAVLKEVDDRFAVDFYGEALHTDSDCRVWLWNKGGALGRPVDIRFVTIPVKKGPDSVADVWSLAVTSQLADGSLKTIAFDYPLCRPAVMAQLQRAQKPGSNAPSPDLEKLVGAELLDEFARRLVNGTYR